MATLRETAEKIIAESEFFDTPKEALEYVKKKYDYRDIFECPFIMKSPKEGLYVAVAVKDVSVLGHVGFTSEYIDTQVYDMLNYPEYFVDEIDDN